MDTTRNPLEHSVLLSVYPNTIIQRTVDGVSFYDKKILFECFSWIANVDGFFAINDTIYQMTDNQIKYTISTNISSAKTTLMNATATDSINNIFVEDITFSQAKVLDGKRSLSTGTHSFSRGCEGNNGRNRTLTYQDFIQTAAKFRIGFTIFDATKSIFRLKTRSLQRRLMGAWYDNKNANQKIDYSITGGAYTSDMDQISNTRNLNYAVTGSTGWIYHNYHTYEIFYTPGTGFTKTLTTLWTSDADNSNDCPNISTSSITGYSQSNNTSSCSCSK
jgi:hypothetical protein